MLTNIVNAGTDPAGLRLDMPLQIEYDDVSSAITLPKFRPAEG